MTKKSKITTLSLASATSIIPILTAQSCKNNDENILLIAHRGAPGGNNTKNTYQFECSKEAYEAAAKQSNI
ncbi:hypothetical protein FACS189459_4680 [Bacilli bacterium]|nr:hypothetical protein FACS189459_4680 [Bacilli bacterium]GHU53460.1 hypothetical protein FACS189496_4830 [Bacilli bacterium]